MVEPIIRNLASRSKGGAELVFQGIQEAVARQRLPPGTKLPEEGLSEIFGVSRAQVRSALARLKLRGLVELEPNRTAQIAAPSVEEVRSIFAIRSWIEPEIAANVASTLDKDAEAKLKDHLNREQAARDSGDRIEATRLAGLFHSLVASFANNKIAREYIDELVDRSFLAIYLYQRVGDLMCVNEDHQILLKAFCDRDPEAARQSMLDHLAHILDRLNLSVESEAVTDLHKAFQDIL